MRVDVHGQVILSEDDVINQLMIDSEWRPKQCVVDFNVVQLYNELDITDMISLTQWESNSLSTDHYDHQCQSNWKMPDEYKNLDIAEWVLLQCETDAERQRVGEELLMYLDRNAFSLLQYLKYLVDTMRQNNIVWGVGRGSSVASYVLYLIGVHKINSIYYSLDINEFLKGE